MVEVYNPSALNNLNENLWFKKNKRYVLNQMKSISKASIKSIYNEIVTFLDRINH